MRWSFFGIFVFTFLGSVFVLARLDLLPEMPSDSTSVSTPSPIVQELPTSEGEDVLKSADPNMPIKIEILKINLSANVVNPTTTDIEILDGELLKGAVRYPTSASLGETGNVVLFGHSSYLPIVHNQAYKTFNGIQKLVAGDTVTVSSTDTAYTYRVRSMTKESANNAAIPLSVAGSVLTLSTCDSFGKKTDRFVVVADFVESHSIPS